MALVNEHLLKLPENYFSSLVEKKVNTFRVTHPHSDILHLESGSACLPLPSSISAAMHQAVEEMGNSNGCFGTTLQRQEYHSLQEAIIRQDYLSKGIRLDKSELFITDGTQGNLADIADLVRHDNSVGIASLSYPIYAAANITNGRAGEFLPNGKWSNVIYIACEEKKEFIPQIPERQIDIVYLCSPHMPTGSLLTKQDLKKWVTYALENDTLIMYDATYEAYIQGADFPHSIYEIKGASKVAIEYKSFSQSTGCACLRCGYLVIPKELNASTLGGKAVSLNQLWKQQQHIRCNGTSPIALRAVEAAYSADGRKEWKEHIQYYLNNTNFMKKELSRMNYPVYGGTHFPFLWVGIPREFSSWQFFDKLLYEAQIVVTPGSIFGPDGEQYIRISGYASRLQCQEAMKRLAQL